MALEDTTKSNVPRSCAGNARRKSPAPSAMAETNVDDAFVVEARIAPNALAPGVAQPQSTMGALRCITIPDWSTFASSKRAAPAQLKRRSDETKTSADERGRDDDMGTPEHAIEFVSDSTAM